MFTKSNPNLESASQAMMKVVKVAKTVAKSDASILLLGETGVGKEVFAEYIHDNSPRRNKPFIPVNCAAIPEQIFESELFGHVKGAFTGSSANKDGLCEVAGGGTLFLDEIAELSFALQAKLLRVLQGGDYRRVGSTKSQLFSGRIIAATNADLLDKNIFRRDLLYRIAVVRIELPPLRARKEDIPTLLEHLSIKHALNPACITAAARKVLLAHDWPGNVRELENAIEYFKAFSSCGEPFEVDEDLALQAIGKQLEVIGWGGDSVLKKESSGGNADIIGSLDLIESGFRSGVTVDVIGQQLFPHLSASSSRVRVSQWLQNKSTLKVFNAVASAASRWPKVLDWYRYYGITGECLQP
jgi:transcriptional regulator with PAS, ATPase and Fis domain